jgi:hypothetical protein
MSGRLPSIHRTSKNITTYELLRFTPFFLVPPTTIITTMSKTMMARNERKQQQQQPQPQWLARFQNQTFLIDAQQQEQEQHGQSHDDLHLLLDVISLRTCWPVQHLKITHTSFPFISISTTSSIRGGKGGFGTLLKGQSKQAGAKLTTDFGACRDLQGRRLRHVNDEIKLRKWHDIQERKRAGENVDEDAEYTNTPSGLHNWHLMIPGWADVSQKATKKLQYQVKQRTALLQRDVTKKRSERDEREREHAAAVLEYVNQSTNASESLNVNDAIQQGLAKMKRKQVCITDDEDAAAHQESILTLSGDFVVDQNKTLQAKSDFSTMALVLEKRPTLPVYYEVQLETAGISQIGWADLTHFRPNTETGDGVGDDAGSFAFDGSRTKKFHNGLEDSYGQACKPGDVIGCLYIPASGEISFLKNGTSMGVAFVTERDRPLVPALSCNQGEILELYMQLDQMKYMPKDCIAVFELMAPFDDDVKPVSTAQAVLEEAPKTPAITPLDHVNKPPTKKAYVVVDDITPEALDLDQYSKVEQLEALGMDRLKSALMAMECKCGGSIQERAKRLFSLKGLERKDYPAKVRAKNFRV